MTRLKIMTLKLIFSSYCTKNDINLPLIVRLHDIARLILIGYCLAPIFKIIIDTIFIYSFRFNIKIVVSRM